MKSIKIEIRQTVKYFQQQKLYFQCFFRENGKKSIIFLVKLRGLRQIIIRIN